MQPLVELTLLPPLASCVTLAKNVTSLKESAPGSHQKLLLSLLQPLGQLLPTRSLLPHFLPLKFLFIPDPA